MQPALSPSHGWPSSRSARVIRFRDVTAPAECRQLFCKQPGLRQVRRATPVLSTRWPVQGLVTSARAAGRTFRSQFVGQRPVLPRWHPRTGKAAAGKTEQASCGAFCGHMPRAKGNFHHPAQGKAGAAWPNPSFKRSANGRPPAPGRWYAVHFHRPGAGVLPSSPA